VLVLAESFPVNPPHEERERGTTQKPYKVKEIET
jgi:hypothetical protein